MRHILKTTALVAFIALGVAAPTLAEAQEVVTCTNCSDTSTQLLEYAKQLQQVETQLQQYSTQLQQYANMVQNTATLPQQIYSTAMSDMERVQGLMTTGSQLSFNNVGTSVGTFSSYLNNTSSAPNDLSAQASQYVTWSTRATNGITAAMNAITAQNSQLSTDNATMTSLQSQAGSATGQTQAIQNSAEIAAQGVRETEKLRQLVMVQVQLAANQQANQTETDAQGQANWQKFEDVTALSDTGETY